MFQGSESECSWLLCLPAELLNKIAQYISVQDLLSCSVTCTRLRSVFNDNMIWRKFCKPEIVHYIADARRKLPPDFNISSLEGDSDLESLCEQRICYIQQNELLNNWKNGRFVEREINASEGLYYTSLKSGTPIIYDDYYLFLYDFFSHTITVWDIKAFPKPYAKIRLLYQNYYYDGLHFEVVGKKLVVLEVGKLIQIFDINLPDKDLPLTSIIMADKDFPLETIPEYHGPEEMYAMCYHKIIENKIYSHKIGKAVLHIWDVETGLKVQTLMPPREGINLDILSAAHNGDDLIVCLEINDHQRQFSTMGKIYEVLRYSVSRDFFRTIWTNTEPSHSSYIPYHAVQHGDIVVLFCRLHNFFLEDSTLPKTVIVLYDYKWGMTIGEKTFPELELVKQARVINNQLTLATAFCLYVLDLPTQEIVSSFKFENGKLELLNVFDGKFIITTPKSLVSVSKTKRKEVWDVKNRCRSMLLTHMFVSAYSKDSIFVNQSFSKMVIVGKGTLAILNFW